MRPAAALAALALAGMIGGCEVSESLGVYREHGAAGASEGSAAVSAAPTTDADTHAAATAAPSTSAGTDASIDTGDPPHCAPAADDDACRGCVKDTCCEALAACEGDPLCVCMKSCVEGGSAPQLCLDLCMPGAVYSSYIACVALHCAPACAP